MLHPDHLLPAQEVLPFEAHPRLVSRGAAPELPQTPAGSQAASARHGASDSYSVPGQQRSQPVAAARSASNPNSGDLAQLPAWGPLLLIAPVELSSPDGLQLVAELRQRRPELLVLCPEAGEPDGWLSFSVSDFGPLWRSVRRATWHAQRHLRQSGAVLLCAGDLSARLLEAAEACAREAQLPLWPVAPGQPQPLLGSPLVLKNEEPREGPAILRRNLTPAQHIAVALRALALRQSSGSKAQSEAQSQARSAPPEALIPAPAQELLALEVAALPPSARLAECGSLVCFAFVAPQAPHMMRAVARLREQTFRAVGEGTGRSSDTDVFDGHYTQLIAWDGERQEIVGGYRLCGVERGAAGVLPALYTRTLFDLELDFFAGQGASLELGRSFVCSAHQKSYAPLLCLWKGIGAYLEQNPHYRYLFGAVSITADYQPLSRALMIAYLRFQRGADGQEDPVAPKQPFDAAEAGWDQWWSEIAANLGGLAELSELVARCERDGKGVPTLLREYLKLGAEVLGFNVDADFNQAVDALVRVDLAASERPLLRRLFSPAGLERYLAVQAGLRS